jgi:hypothetical protein
LLEADGGTRAGYKEDLSKGKMLRFEDSLPRLPVPTLEGNEGVQQGIG